MRALFLLFIFVLPNFAYAFESESFTVTALHELDREGYFELVSESQYLREVRLDCTSFIHELTFYENGSVKDPNDGSTALFGEECEDLYSYLTSNFDKGNPVCMKVEKNYEVISFEDGRCDSTVEE